MKTKRITALALSLVMALACLPAWAVSGVSADAPEDTRVQNTGNLQVDLDGSDGYTGDYVMIYNPDETYGSTRSTGDLSGLISTVIDSTPVSISKKAEDGDELYIIDVDPEIEEYDLAHDPHYDRIDVDGGVRASYNVGDTRSFYVSSSYSPSGTTSLTFKVLYKGDHCYVWTTAENLENYYPLDSIDTSYAEQIAAEFDRVYPLMYNAFGAHSNGSNGDGRVSLLFFNLDDGYEPGVSTSYTAGYFSGSSYTYDKMPVINLDTYPGLARITDGELTPRPVSTCFHTCVHEYQHCINYSNGRTDTWLNEGFSGAAEEICYPGSSVNSRVPSWLNHKYSSIGDWLTPPTEVEYVSTWHQHTGFSLYNWEKGQADILAEYAQVLLFTQYIYSQYDNSKLREILDYCRAGETEQQAIAHAMGVSCSEVVKRYRVALCANDPNSLGGLYGFRMQADYVAADYHNVSNLYDLLCPVVFTGTSAELDGGSAIWVKPLNGTFYPPAGANSGLQYVGITLNAAPDRTLTVEYLFEDGSEAAPAHVESLAAGAGYYVESPAILGYYADPEYVEGVMPDEDLTLTVVYRLDFEPLPGDVDGDGELSFQDVSVLYMYLLGMHEHFVYYDFNADVDGDGEVDFNDVNALVQMLLTR